MKLELKHYLDAFKYKVPCRLSSVGVFNLDLEYPNDDCRGDGIITEISTNGVYLRGTISFKNGCAFDFDFKLAEEPEIELIYRPLSDLTKEIEVNGKKFVPIDVLNENGFTKYSLKHINFVPYLLAEFIAEYNILSPNCAKDKLYEWGFDVDGLIKKGLAIEKQ